MADPRFYDNRGPFTLAAICEAGTLALPFGADGATQIADLASLSGAGPRHLTFFAGGNALKEQFLQSRAGFCLVPASGVRFAPDGMVTIPVASVPHAWAAIAALFYPGAMLGAWKPAPGVAPDARLGKGVTLGPGAIIGPGAEIGEGTAIGPNAVIGAGVAIGRNCEIGANVSISHAYLGDGVAILPGARIGQPGFGFASSGEGHAKIAQLGRVIIQDRAEVGAATTIDRGALGDTVIGEGSKIDNLVQIGHNVQLGRHCVIAAQSGIAGSCVIEDFVVMGGQVGLGDHSHIGAGARLAARTATVSGQKVPGGQDYGGVPAKPVREWAREIHAVKRLAARRKQDDHG
jgi:UDP-3-O-[3-hydroxymyristoyl] glucosamine N-acyltransferase